MLDLETGKIKDFIKVGAAAGCKRVIGSKWLTWNAHMSSGTLYSSLCTQHLRIGDAHIGLDAA